MSENYVAVSEKNDNGIIQYVSVNTKDMLEYIDDMASYGEEPPYISIGYCDTRDKYPYNTKEFPRIDINMYLSGAITVYDDIAFIRHFKNDPGMMQEIYNHIVLLTNAASYSMNYEDVFVAISNKIFEILKDWVHPLDVSEEYGLSGDRSKLFFETKLRSTFSVSIEKVGREEYCNTVSFVSSEIMQSEPILYLSKTVERNSVEFLIYPDGSIFVKDFPTWQHFDDIEKFGGVRILEFCKDCNSYYKSIGGDLSKEDSFGKYKSLVKDLTRELKAWRG